MNWDSWNGGVVDGKLKCWNVRKFQTHEIIIYEQYSI